MSFKDMRKQATKGGDTQRQVVKLDDPLGGEQASSTTTPVTTKPVPVQSTRQEVVEATRRVEAPQQPLDETQDALPSLEELLAQVMQAVMSSPQGSDEEVPLDGKVTLYFEPAHMEKLLEVRKRFKGSREQLPNLQDVMRYLVEKIQPDFFDDFPKYIYEKRMQKMRVMLEKRVGKLTRETRAQLKGLFPE